MKAILWSKYDCLHCNQAKSLLETYDFEIEERKIGDGWTKEDLLESVPNARSVPQIFIENNYIGSLKELQQYIQDNKVERTSDVNR